MKYSDGYVEIFGEEDYLYENDHFENSAYGALKLVRRMKDMFGKYGEGWCKNHIAEDIYGDQVESQARGACKWCLSGAIARATGVEADTFEGALEWHNEQNEIPEDFVDQLDKSLKEVSGGRNQVFPEYWDSHGSLEAFNDSRDWGHVEELLCHMEDGLEETLKRREDERKRREIGEAAAQAASSGVAVGQEAR